MTDAAEATFRGAGPEGPLLEDDNIGLAALGEEERGRDADDAPADDERRRAVRDAQSASSVNRSLPSRLLMVPNRGRSWVKPTSQCSSTARARIVRLASRVSSG